MSRSSSVSDQTVLGRTEDDVPITALFITNMHRCGFYTMAAYYVEAYCPGFTYDPTNGIVAYVAEPTTDGDTDEGHSLR